MTTDSTRTTRTSKSRQRNSTKWRISSQPLSNTQKDTDGMSKSWKWQIIPTSSSSRKSSKNIVRDRRFSTASWTCRSTGRNGTRWRSCSSMSRSLVSSVISTWRICFWPRGQWVTIRPYLLSRSCFFPSKTPFQSSLHWDVPTWSRMTSPRLKHCWNAKTQ